MKGYAHNNRFATSCRPVSRKRETAYRAIQVDFDSAHLDSFAKYSKNFALLILTICKINKCLLTDNNK